MPEPINKELYSKAIEIVNQIYGTHTSAYRSMAIQKYYKAIGGTYRDDKKPKKLQIWKKELWVNLNNPIKQGNKIIGYNKCGSPNTQNNLYPLCRPSKVIDKNTPQTYQTINKQKIAKVNKQKQILQKSGNILF